MFLDPTNKINIGQLTVLLLDPNIKKNVFWQLTILLPGIYFYWHLNTYCHCGSQMLTYFFFGLLILFNSPYPFTMISLRSEESQYETLHRRCTWRVMMRHLLSQDTRCSSHCWSVFTPVVLRHRFGWNLLRVVVYGYSSPWVTFSLFRGVGVEWKKQFWIFSVYIIIMHL